VSDWKTELLGELADSIDYGVTASAVQRPVGPKFLRITDIQEGAVDWGRVPWCEYDARASTDARLRPGDIVFARTGATTGKSFLIRDCPENTVFASYLIRVRLGKRAEPRFISHYFRTPQYWAQIARRARGVAQPGVNATTLKQLKVPVPPLREQQRIAELLDRANVLCATRRRTMSQIDVLADATFLELFGDPLVNPKRWPQTSVSDVANVQGGLQLSRARNALPVEVPYLRVANVYRGFLDLTEIKTMRATPAEVTRTRLCDGDLLVVEGHGNAAEIGRCAVWDGSIRECVHQNHLIRARFDRRRIDPIFASAFLNSFGGRQHLLRASGTTSGLNTISVADVRAAPIALPPLSLQSRFATFIRALGELKGKQRASLVELNSLFDSLQHRAFSGAL
jgi:type I restriction enzyme S subunit